MSLKAFLIEDENKSPVCLYADKSLDHANQNIDHNEMAELFGCENITVRELTFLETSIEFDGKIAEEHAKEVTTPQRVYDFD